MIYKMRSVCLVLHVNNHNDAHVYYVFYDLMYVLGKIIEDQSSLFQ